MDFQLVDVDLLKKFDGVTVVSPYTKVPVLVYSDLVLYEPNIICEYIDERFPHPQLMPPDIQSQARARQMLLTMDQEFVSHIDAIERNFTSAEK